VQRPGYEDQQIHGWKVRYETTDWGTLRLKLSETLYMKLQEIENTLPALSLSKVRKEVCIHVDLVTTDSTDVAVYHSTESVGWLISHREPPEKASSINILDAQRFIDMVESPSSYLAALLHEVAHAFHDRFLDGGFNNLRVQEAFDAANAHNKYRNVKNVSGKIQNSNAITNHKEYFANNTTAYFMRNDDFPFTNEELLSYDPGAFTLLQECWI